MEKYYVLERNGEVRRIAKIDNGNAYGYEKGHWTPMQHLLKIQWDDTDFVEIPAKRVKQLI